MHARTLVGWAWWRAWPARRVRGTGAEVRVDGRIDPTLRRRGGVPWSVDGLLEAVGRRATLGRDYPGNSVLAVVKWVVDRYGGDEGLAHGERLLRVIGFLQAHGERLMDERLLRAVHDDVNRYSGALLHVLATARFTRVVRDERASDGVGYEFDVEEVVRMAKGLG